MFDLIASLLAFFFDFSDSYGISVALLTIGVLLLATPLTLQGTKSMLKMQILQPDIKAIQERHKGGDREAMNAEMMAFYKENNINPVGGCVPMLFQIPVFLVLYRVVLGLTRRSTDIGSNFGSVAGSVAAGDTPVGFESSDQATFNPQYLDEGSKLFEELSNSNEMRSFGFDISRSASDVLSGDGFIDSLPYLGMVLIVFATGWYQNQMIRRRQTGAAVNPTQEMIMKIMPFFLPVFAFTIPAAAVVYFLVSNVYRIGQQAYITRSLYSGEDSLGAQARRKREQSNKPGSSKKSPSKAKAKSSAGSKSSNKKKSSGGHSKRYQGADSGSTNGSSKGSSPGRNSSGRAASARSQVTPRARKKKR